MFRRGILTATVLAMGAASAGLGAAAPAAASAPRKDPTITITVAGTRTAATGNPAGLAGVVFTATGNTNGATGSCTAPTGAGGSCTLSITTGIAQTYTIAAATVPAGWFTNPTLGTGSAPLTATNTGTSYFTTGSIGPAASVTFPVSLNTSSLMSRGSQLAFSRTDTPEPTTCGLRVALLFDLSTSIVSPTDNLEAYRAAGRSFVTALEGTPSEVAVYTFGTNAPATSAGTTGNNDTLMLRPVATTAQADIVRDKITGLTVQGSQYTNWDAGLWQIAASGDHYDVVIVLTDGDPTRHGRPTATTLPTGTGVATRFIDVENGIFSANALKATTGTSVAHPAVIAVGINVPSPASHLNLRAISADGDFYTTGFAGLAGVLDRLARDQCLGSINVVKNVIPHGGTVDEAVSGGAGWEFHSTEQDETHVTGGSGAVSFETGASTTPTTIIETQKSGYTSLPQHTRCVNTVTGAEVPITDVAARRFTVTPDPAGIISCEVFNEQPLPEITIVKEAYPTEYGAEGEEIAYTYTVKNTGQVPLHDVTVTDDRIRVPIVCLDTTLVPGQSTTCKAIYTITEDDLEAGHVINTATATGHPPVGPPATDTDTDTVREIYEPGIQIEKTAFPTEYAVPGEVITYSYQVVNTGNKTLHGITVTDSRLGTVTCPRTTLAPGETMTCHGTYVTTAADVAAGAVTNVAIATGHPPTGPAVSDRDLAITLGLPLVPVTG